MDAAAAMPDLTSTPADANQARTALDALRQQRLDGLVGEVQYLARSDFLARLANGEQASAPDLTARTSEEQLHAAFEQAMAPAKPDEYQFTWTEAVQDEFGQAFDAELRTAFSAAGIPKELGGSLFQAIDQHASRIVDGTPDQQQSAINVTAGLLRQRFGDQFNARIDAIDEIVAIATATSAALAELMDERPWLLADLEVMLTLDAIAQHRVRSRNAK
jgi:hypothetical protein